MKRILLVDDHDAARQALKTFLEMQGYEVEEAEHGTGALALLDRGHAFDLVISDNQMPIMTGLEFIQTLAQRSYPSTHPVILYTANLTEELEQQALELGVHAVFPKPYDFRELLETVGQVCEDR